MTNTKNITDIHLGLDLSLKGTGMSIYLKNDNINLHNIRFYRLVFDKAISANYMNINQFRIKIPQILDGLDMNYYDDGIYNNSSRFSGNQMDHTKLFVTMVSMILKKIRETIRDHGISHNEINLYVNMEGSILSGYDFNSQVALNMLQGLLRGDLLKIHLSDNFNHIKFRIVPPTALKNFFTGYGKATKEQMMDSFIRNYNGKKLIPQANVDKKTVEKLNDIVDSFALIAYNVYDIKFHKQEKLLFNKYVVKSLKPKKRKQKLTRLSTALNKNIPNITEDFLNNIDSKILNNNKIISL